MKKRNMDAGKYDLKGSVVKMLAAVVLIAVPILFQRMLPSTWISDTFKPISRSITRGLTYLFGVLPFSVAEVLIYLLILCLFAYITRTVVQMIRKKQPLRILFRSTSMLAVTVGSLFFIFNLFWGMNYFSLSLSEELDINVGSYSVEALRQTTESFVVELNQLAGEVPRDAQGVSKFASFPELSAMASEGWLELAATNSAFAGAGAARTKPVLMSEAMSYTGITGIYIPFTGEANVNIDVPDSSLPFTMAHELAHAAGVAPENEANYAAFLACRVNPHAEFRYSGYLGAFIYSYNALMKEDAAAASQLRGMLDERVETDLRTRSAYWAKFKGKLESAASKVNNTYLMAMSQADGVKSYGMVVDLLIADYISQNGNPDLA